MEQDTESNGWDDDDDQFVVLLVDDPAPKEKYLRPERQRTIRKMAKTQSSRAPSLTMGLEDERANKVPNEMLATTHTVHAINLKQDFDSFQCWVGMSQRVGTLGYTAWFAPRQGWVPFLAEMRFKFLAFLVELHMGCWTGWSYHTQLKRIYPVLDDSFRPRPELQWSFCKAQRIASPLSNAPLKELDQDDWIFSGDRIVITMQHLFVPAWLQHSPKFYDLCQQLWRYIPDVRTEPRQSTRDSLSKRDLIPLPRQHPQLSSLIQFMHDSFAHSMFPARISTKPAFSIQTANKQLVLGEIPGVKQRLWALASRDPELKYLSREQLEQRLWMGTRRPVEKSICKEEKDEEEETVSIAPLSMVSFTRVVFPECFVGNSTVSWPCPDNELNKWIQMTCNVLQNPRTRILLDSVGTRAFTFAREQEDRIVFSTCTRSLEAVFDRLQLDTRYSFEWIKSLRPEDSAAACVVNKKTGLSFWTLVGNVTVQLGNCRVNTGPVKDGFGRGLPFRKIPARLSNLEEVVFKYGCERLLYKLFYEPIIHDKQGFQIVHEILKHDKDTIAMTDWKLMARVALAQKWNLPLTSEVDLPFRICMTQESSFCVGLGDCARFDYDTKLSASENALYALREKLDTSFETINGSLTRMQLD